MNFKGGGDRDTHMSDKAPKDQEQKAAEAKVEEFRKELGPFVTAAEATRMAMAFTDSRKADNPIIFANDAFLELTGYDRDEVLAQSFNFILASGADEKTVRQVEAAFANPSENEPEIHYRRKMEASAGRTFSSPRSRTSKARWCSIFCRWSIPRITKWQSKTPHC
jgi:PAS domain S-box-containing protein